MQKTLPGFHSGTFISPIYLFFVFLFSLNSLRSFLMKVLPLLIAAGLVSGAAFAQGPVLNAFSVFPDSGNGSATSFTSRFQATTPAQKELEVLVRYPKMGYGPLFDGSLGGGTMTIGAFRRVGQDQDRSTQENWRVIIRKDKAGKPDASASGILFRSSPSLTPKGTGIGAFILTTTFKTPIKVPNNADIYVGMEFAAITGPKKWPSDGQSNHAASFIASFPRGDNPRAGVPNPAWGIVHGTPPVVSQPSGRWLRQWVFTAGAVLQQGGVDPNNTRQTPKGSPNYASGGIYPDVLNTAKNRFDDLALRIVDGNSKNGIAAILWDTGRGPGIGLSGIFGKYGLGVTVQVLTAIPMGTTGVKEMAIPLGPKTSPVRAILKGKKIHWQAFLFKTVGSGFRTAFSNVATHNF
jgi:hypothetical protein